MPNEVQAGGFTPDCYDEFQRVADTTAYAAGDSVNATTQATAAVPLRFNAIRQRNGSCVITGGRMIKSTNTTTNASFRLWLFAASPFTLPVQGVGGGYPADNAAITFTYASMARFVGFLDFTTFINAGSMAVGVGLPTRNLIVASKRFVGDKDDSGADALSMVGVPQPITAAFLLYGILEARAAYAPGSAEQFRIWLDSQAD